MVDDRTSNPISEWRAAAASYEGYTTVAERNGRVGRMYRAGLALAEIAGKWRGTLERLERQLRGYAEFSPADELHRTVTDALAGLPDETTTLTEAEELLKAWADPLPPNGRLYWAHVEKAREYFKKRPAVEPSAPPETLRQSLDRIRPELREIVERWNRSEHEKHMCTEDCRPEKASADLPACECLVRNKSPSAYHNVKCPRYVADLL